MNTLIRNIPDTLWRRARSKAAREGRTIRAVLIALLRAWVSGRPLS